jgi:hypothetical protein
MEKNIDYRLDLFNAIKEYNKNAIKEDNAFIILYNLEKGDLMLSSGGDPRVISSIFTNENNFIKLDGEAKTNWEDMRKALLNAAVNCIRTDNDVKGMFVTLLFNELKLKQNLFLNIGVKFVCELRNGEINTWNCELNKSIEDIIREMRYKKDWMGGRFLEIFVYFTIEKNYHKYYLDVKNNKFNQLLGS